MSVTVEKCLQAWTNSLRQMNAKADIVFFGDSLTYYGDFSSVFPDKIVCNLGLRGDTLVGMFKRVDQVKLLNPTLIFLMAGINDVSKRSLVDFRKDYEQLVREIILQVPEGKLVLQSILPVNSTDFQVSCNNTQIQACNEVIENISEIYKLDYIDLYSIYLKYNNQSESIFKDGIHIKEREYNTWKNLLKLHYKL